MTIGERIYSVRTELNLSQGDVEKRTGLLRSSLSRFENGHTVPSIATLEKLAAGMGVHISQFFEQRK